MTPPQLRLLLLVAAITALTACPGFGDEEPDSSLTVVPDRPTYTEHVKLILDANCVECHAATPRNGAPQGTRLDVYDNPAGGLGAKALAPRIVVRSVSSPSNPMPPTTRPQLGEIDRKTLARWVEQGAPLDAATAVNNTPELDAGTNNNPGVVTFDGAILAMFERNTCILCHGAAIQKGGIRLDTLADTLATGDVQPCNADGSVLVQKLRDATVPFGDLMPQGGPEIPEADLQLLKGWIDAGAETQVCDAPADVGPDVEVNNNPADDVGVDADAPTPVGMKRDFSGTYLLALATPVAEAPVLLGVQVTVAPELDTIAFSIQPLRADRLANPRQPVGNALQVPAATFAADGSFLLELGLITLPADANPAGDQPIEAVLTLQGYVCGGELFCGDASGVINAPVEASLTGSTFGAVVSANFVGATPVSMCAPGWCGL